ncbi:DUF6671 family protein [Nocardioides okcheonensis]|uniref:DUF6671 family protein n=1 Tax=Nocardioides okcheonensis TaxID=2894081 RepID=UPI001E30D43E|nr:DUF6671 family protein [Nocardioides okcheonensis]UFN45127.1 hypothetical protein LN652_02590 [Nocardioides okcheonensis]
MSSQSPSQLPHGHDLAGARAAVATKHRKTLTIARALGGPHGLRLQTAAVDTDALGTFTGETPRPGTPRHTAAVKARWACHESGLNLGIGSEGSFSPHPEVGFITVQVEHVALIEASTGLTIVGTATGGAPWAVRRTQTPDQDLHEFRDLLASGTQRLVVRPTTPHTDGRGITKGIASTEHLRDAVRAAVEHDETGRATIETDLRAHHCTPRHSLIQAAARDLALRLATRCPACSSFGFGYERSRRGAPCGWCGTPTTTVRHHVYSCPACHHTDTQTLEGSDRADPGTCPECNP